MSQSKSRNKISLRKALGWPIKSKHATPDLTENSSANLIQFAQSDVEILWETLNTSLEGLSDLQSRIRLEKIGLNEIAHEKPPKWYVQFLRTFQNPLVVLLISLAIIAWLTGDIKAGVIILSMVVFSVILRFSQEFRSSQAAEKLREMVHTTATVSRRDPRKDISPGLAKELGLTLNLDVPERQEIPIQFLVPGDVIFLSAGDMIPADVRLIAAKDLFVSQGALTGESLPVEKYATLPDSQFQNPNPL